MTNLDQIELSFSPSSLILLKCILAIIMYGVSLDIRAQDLIDVVKKPKGMIVGMVAQFVLLPFFSYILISIVNPQPSVALGMFIIASCPGGNFSNFLTYISKGNVALSVGMSFFSTLIGLFMTSFNITFWGKLYEPTNVLVQSVQLNPWEVVESIVLMLGVPLFIGVLMRAKNPALAAKHEKFLKKFSMIFLGLFVAGALVVNIRQFIDHIHQILFIVFLQNAAALLSGYLLATLCRVSEADRRAITIEVGVQNSGLGLALIFEFFKGLGGAAMVAAWWGVWHSISGFSLAYWWTRKRNLKFLENNLENQNEERLSNGI